MIYESCCPLVLPRSCHDPREIKKKKKRNLSTHTPLATCLEANSRREIVNGNDGIASIQLLDLKTLGIYPYENGERLVSPTRALYLSLSLIVRGALVTMAKVEWNQSYNFVWTRAVAQVNSMPRNCSRAILDWSSPKMPCCSLFDAMRRFYTSTNEGSKAMRSFLLNHLFEFFAFLEKK